MSHKMAASMCAMSVHTLCPCLPCLCTLHVVPFLCTFCVPVCHVCAHSMSLCAISVHMLCPCVPCLCTFCVPLCHAYLCTLCAPVCHVCAHTLCLSVPCLCMLHVPVCHVCAHSVSLCAMSICAHGVPLCAMSVCAHSHVPLCPVCLHTPCPCVPYLSVPLCLTFKGLTACHWFCRWDQPAQFTTPWVKMQDLTFQQWFNKWKIIVTKIRQLEVHR